MAIRAMFLALALVLAGGAWAKLPAAPAADPAKAAADKQKADEAAKKDAELLAKVQDKAAANYKKNRAARPVSAQKPAAKN
jgi:hypothetical protein